LPKQLQIGSTVIVRLYDGRLVEAKVTAIVDSVIGRLPGASLVSWRVLAGLRSATVGLHREKIHAAYNLKAEESNGLQQEALLQKARFADMNGKSRVVSRSRRNPNHSHRRVSTSANAPCRQKRLGWRFVRWTQRRPVKTQPRTAHSLKRRTARVE
jgi:hypothetical protein